MSNTPNKSRTSEVDGADAPGSVAAQSASTVPATPGAGAGQPGTEDPKPATVTARPQSAPTTPARIPGYTAPRPMARHGFRLCTVVGVPVSSGGRTYPVGHEGEFAISDVESLPHCLVPVG